VVRRQAAIACPQGIVFFLIVRLSSLPNEILVVLISSGLNLFFTCSTGASLRENSNTYIGYSYVRWINLTLGAYMGIVLNDLRLSKKALEAFEQTTDEGITIVLYFHKL
jgi:hypothetical protein